MQIVKINSENAALVAPLAAAFRVTLKAFRGIQASPDNAAGLEEITEYLDAGFPIFAALDENGTYAGYIVCRVDAPTVWVESIFVLEDYRRMGVASLLLKEAEAIAGTYGENTVFNYVHPNNERMIAFLRKHGYTVLNLIEIRKPYAGEKISQRIRVGETEFDY